jgi:large subunit ribosomal protein L25
VTGLDVGDSIHISQVTLPAGSESAITDRDFTIATVVAPSGMRSRAAEAKARPRAKPKADPRLVSGRKRRPA